MKLPKNPMEKPLKDKIEKILRKLFAEDLKEEEVADQILFLIKEEKPHPTKNGYCCACEYDLAVFKKKLKEEKQKWAEEIELEINNGKMWSRKKLLELLDKTNP